MKEEVGISQEQSLLHRSPTVGDPPGQLLVLRAPHSRSCTTSDFSAKTRCFWMTYTKSKVLTWKRGWKLVWNKVFFYDWYGVWDARQHHLFPFLSTSPAVFGFHGLQPIALCIRQKVLLLGKFLSNIIRWSRNTHGSLDSDPRLWICTRCFISRSKFKMEQPRGN